MHRLFSYPQLLALAAAVAGLLIVAFLVLRPKATGPAPFSEPSDLYATHFSALPANNLRGGDDQPWLPAYSNGDYQTAVRLIDSALTVPNVSAPSEKYLYLGIALLAQGQPEAALNALDKVSRNSFDWPSAQWYKALALLKLNRPENARPILERIAADRKDPQREQAGKILEALHQSR